MNEQTITSERLILQNYLKEGRKFPTEIKRLFNPLYNNPVLETDLGKYRPFDRKKVVTADLEVLQEFQELDQGIPGFLEAGPREKIAFNIPERPDEALRIAVVTTGGLAPGLNSVVHSIVERHLNTYGKLINRIGGVWGFRESFKGLAGDTPNWIKLTSEMTEDWLDKAGAELGAIRFRKLHLKELSKKITDNLERWGFNILYVIGGDGSLTAAHEIAKKAQKTIVVGIPKTMDNDILWVWQSFGFNTAVARAAAFINTMHAEVESTRRVCILELFGARSGFVAANASLASGHVDLVMIPEVFEKLSKKMAENSLKIYSDYLVKTIQRKSEKPHAIIVIAEGVGEVLSEIGVNLDGKPILQNTFPEQFKDYLKLYNIANEKVSTFTLQPRYYIRAIPANSHDHIYCKRLGALAVDNALAGYTDFMISQWLTEYVLVPLELVAGGQKHVPPGGIFWKQVVSNTGQPPLPIE